MVNPQTVARSTIINSPILNGSRCPPNVVSALSFLRVQPSIDKTRLAIMGASIGANLAVIVAANDEQSGKEPPISCLVLLSPGLNYHGVQPVGQGHDLDQMPVLIIAGTANTQSIGGAQALSNAARGAELQQFNGSAHGTALFQADPNMIPNIVDWLRKYEVPRQRDASSASNPPSGQSQGTSPAPGTMPGAPPKSPGGGL